MSDGSHVEGERLRLFTAVDVPTETLEQLEGIVDPYRAEISNARWAPVANQHLTLKFLGHVGSEMLAEIAAACGAAGARVAPGEITVSGFGAFPSARRARVLWAGIVDESEVLPSIATALDELLAPLGFEREKRAYTPHLTLARLKVPADVRGVLERLDYVSAPSRVGAFHLYRSRLSPKGARYEVLETFALAGPA